MPDESDGSTPAGDWTQLVGASYDRTMYAFGIQTTEAQDDAFIQAFNPRLNENKFNLLFNNCADFVRQAINFYYPKTIRRSFSSDVGIMTPKRHPRNPMPARSPTTLRNRVRPPILKSPNPPSNP